MALIARFVKWYLSLKDLYLCIRCESAMVEVAGQMCNMCLFEEE